MAEEKRKQGGEEKARRRAAGRPATAVLSGLSVRRQGRVVSEVLFVPFAIALFGVPFVCLYISLSFPVLSNLSAYFSPFLSLFTSFPLRASLSCGPGGMARVVEVTGTLCFWGGSGLGLEYALSREAVPCAVYPRGGMVGP